MSPKRAGRPAAASSVAPGLVQPERSLRPCIEPPSAPRRRAVIVLKGQSWQQSVTPNGSVRLYWITWVAARLTRRQRLAGRHPDPAEVPDEVGRADGVIVPGRGPNRQAGQQEGVHLVQVRR